MIHLNIQRKVFFASFALAAAMAALMIGLTRWNLEQGFIRYVVETEIGKLDWLVKDIEDAYASNASWKFLQEGNGPWDRLVERAARAHARTSRSSGEESQNDPPEPADRAADWRGPPGFERRPPRFGPPGPPSGGPRPVDLLGVQPRLSIRDPTGKVLAGNRQSLDLMAARPLNYQSKMVGQLTLQAPHTENARDAAFLATQTRDLWLSGLAALLFSLLAAWLLARHFLEPIKALASAARQFAEGRFAERVMVDRSDELGQLAAGFNTMAEMLAQTEEARRQWVSDSSHELRTPIAVLRAEIEALQDGVRISDEKTLARLHKHVMQMGKLVDDLRQTLDRDSGHADLELTQIAPLAVLRETLEEFRARYALANITLDDGALPQTDPGWHISGDAGRLQQVFANLLENTLRYTHQGGVLKVSAQTRSGTLRLQFDDTPPAPPEPAMPRLFERFFRAEPSRSRQHGGSGLGLAICKTIVQGHGGSIGAGKSSLGGLCIRIDLPLGG